MATWTLSKIGAKHAGTCIVCGNSTGKQALAVTPLYTTQAAAAHDMDATKYGVAHAECVGAKVKAAINGPRLIGSPAATVNDSEAKAAFAVSATDMAKLESLTAELRETAPFAPAGKTWPAPADVAAALKMYDCGMADAEEVAWAIQKLGQKVAARRALIPGRKIEIE